MNTVKLWFNVFGSGDFRACLSAESEEHSKATIEAFIKEGHFRHIASFTREIIYLDGEGIPVPEREPRLVPPDEDDRLKPFSADESAGRRP